MPFGYFTESKEKIKLKPVSSTEEIRRVPFLVSHRLLNSHLIIIRCSQMTTTNQSRKLRTTFIYPEGKPREERERVKRVDL